MIGFRVVALLSSGGVFSAAAASEEILRKSFEPFFSTPPQEPISAFGLDCYSDAPWCHVSEWKQGVRHRVWPYAVAKLNFVQRYDIYCLDHFSVGEPIYVKDPQPSMGGDLYNRAMQHGAATDGGKFAKFVCKHKNDWKQTAKPILFHSTSVGSSRSGSSSPRSRSPAAICSVVEDGFFTQLGEANLWKIEHIQKLEQSLLFSEGWKKDYCYPDRTYFEPIEHGWSPVHGPLFRRREELDKSSSPSTRRSSLSSTRRSSSSSTAWPSPSSDPSSPRTGRSSSPISRQPSSPSRRQSSSRLVPQSSLPEPRQPFTNSIFEFEGTEGQQKLWRVSQKYSRLPDGKVHPIVTWFRDGNWIREDTQNSSGENVRAYYMPTRQPCGEPCILEREVVKGQGTPFWLTTAIGRVKNVAEFQYSVEDV